VRSMVAAAVAAFTAAAPLPAIACHRFQVWNYPWPQRCAVASQIIRPVRVIPEPPDPPALPKPTPRAVVTPPPVKRQMRKETTK
jgi:hypothetical protein